MEDITKKSIIISGIEDKGTGINIMEQVGGQAYPTKYSLFKNRKDGGLTKAYQQFKEINPEVGNVVTIGVKETRATNKVGKAVTYRNIAFFYDEGDIETQPKPSGDRIDKMAKWASDVSKKLGQIEERLYDLENATPTKPTTEEFVPPTTEDEVQLEGIPF